MRIIFAFMLRGMLELRRDLRLLSVLPTARHREKHIPGSSNVPYDAEDPVGFAERVEEVVADKGDEVVVYCAGVTSDLSPRAARALREAGFEKVTDFEGGLAAWERAGYPLETAAR